MTTGPSIAFVLPAGRDAITGGNLVNEALLEALAARTSVRSVEEASCDAELAALERAGATTYLVDTMCLAGLERLLAARPPGVRVWLLGHLLPSQDPAASAEARAAEARVLPRLDGAIVLSSFMRGALIDRGVAAARVVELEPGLATWARPAETPRVAARTAQLLVVANLSPVKGVAELLGALARLAAPTDAFALRVIGEARDVAYAERCRALAAAPVLAGRVALVGPRPHPTLGDDLRAADLLVSPAHIESYGLALAEARAAGVPLAVLAGGHAAAHVTPTTGVVAPTIDALADAVLALVRDRDRRQALLDAAFAAARDLPHPGWGAAADRLLDALRAG